MRFRRPCVITRLGDAPRRQRCEVGFREISGRRCNNTSRSLVTFHSVALLLIGELLSAEPPRISIRSARPDPAESSFPADVSALLVSAYLGHEEGFPDFGEPFEVLDAYLKTSSHRPTQGVADKAQELKEIDSEIDSCTNLVAKWPSSRHALAAFAGLYAARLDVSGSESDLGTAVAFYRRASAGPGSPRETPRGPMGLPTMMNVV
jgi:hypothetical protein